MIEPVRAAGERLRIAVIAHVRYPIRPPFAGGMEAHTWHLVRGLAERGHKVTLLASGDSDAGVGLHVTLHEHYERSMPWAVHHGTARFDAGMHDVFARACQQIECGRYDIIHNNALHPLPIERARCIDMPMLTSLHVPPFPALDRAVGASVSSAQRFTVTSERQRALWWPTVVPDTATVVHNGIDPAVWPFQPVGDGSLIWAGRIAPNKGTHVAAGAARLSGRSLSIVGPIEDRDYFNRAVSPLLGGGIRYQGHVTGTALAQAFGRSSALLFTPLWDEPFGLVAIEAMACGLPVACLDHGAAREVVGEAGAYALADDAPSLAKAVEEALEIPRCAARRRVERHFSLAMMLDAYEAQYRACMVGSNRESCAPNSAVCSQTPFRRCDRRTITAAQEYA